MSFLDLLAQAVAGIHPDVDTNPQQPDPAQPAPNNEIVVTGNVASPRDDSRPVDFPPSPSITLSNGPDAPDLGNRSYVEAARAAIANDSKKQSHVHRMLDNIGDAIYRAWGMEPAHNQQRDEEDLKNAMQGFTDNPLAAFERANAVAPEFAAKHYDEYQKNQYNATVAKSLIDNRTDQAADRKFTNVNQARASLQRLISRAQTPDQRAWVAQNYGPLLAAQAGVTPADLGIVPGMDDTQLKNFGEGDMTVYQQEQLPIRQQTADAATLNSQAHMKNASRPPRPVQPRAVTNVQTYVGEDGYQYTQRSDGTVIKSPTKVRPTRSGIGRRSVAPAPSTGWGTVTRN